VLGKQIVIGASVGYAVAPDDGGSLEQLIACADTALYDVKRRGGGSAGCGDAAIAPTIQIAG
jgi:predicted signal transduction protein with EAL and GGDEF domain